MSTQMILVTGATGQFGRTVVERLIALAPERRHAMAVLARDPSRAAPLAALGVEVRQGDYTDSQSLTRAFRGVATLLFVSTSALTGVVEQHANVLRAAERAGVTHVVFTSVIGRSADPPFRLVRDYRQTEEELIASGMTYTILRNGYYMDMLPMFIGDAQDSGTIRYPAGDGANNFTSRSDLAEAAARVLTGEGHEDHVYDLCGSVAYTFRDVAGVLSDITGRQVGYEDLSLEAYRAMLEGAGTPKLEADLMIGMAASIRASEGRSSSQRLEELLGRPPMDLAQFLRAQSTGA